LEDVFEILKILGIGAIVSAFFAAFFNYIFHHLSSKRQFRQALDQKMIDRVSDLVESYYGQISSSSQNLLNALDQTLSGIKAGKNVATAEKMCFYLLARYFHHLERLRQERPVPLFTEISAEEDYLLQFHQVYQSLPFGFYDVSFLLSCFQTKEGIKPAHEFVELVNSDSKLQRCYEVFSDWLGTCRCVDPVDPNCNVHKVIEACRQIVSILDDQTKKMYCLWYERRRKKPEKRGD